MPGRENGAAGAPRTTARSSSRSGVKPARGIVRRGWVRGSRGGVAGGCAAGNAGVRECRNGECASEEARFM